MSDLAGIEYVGISGGSKDCMNAVLRLIHYGDRIRQVRILTSKGEYAFDHCLLLTVNNGDLVAVKSGFGSGYRGEGPRTFSFVLKVLERTGTEIEEHDVPQEIVERLDNSALTVDDLDYISTSPVRRPARWTDYIDDQDWQRDEDGTLWQDFPSAMPLAVVDSRLIDLALAFWGSPDQKLLAGYRRLEEVVRKRTNLQEHGAKLFSKAFEPGKGKLTWDEDDSGERVGRMNLFAGPLRRTATRGRIANSAQSRATC